DRKRSGGRGRAAEVALEFGSRLEVIRDQARQRTLAHLLARDQRSVDIGAAAALALDHALAAQAVEHGEDGGVGQRAAAAGQARMHLGHGRALERPEGGQALEFELRQLGAGTRSQAAPAAFPRGLRPRPAADRLRPIAAAPSGWHPAVIIPPLPRPRAWRRATARCAAADARASGCSWSIRLPPALRPRAGCAWPASSNPYHPTGAAAAPRGTWAAWASRTHSGRDG